MGSKGRRKRGRLTDVNGQKQKTNFDRGEYLGSLAKKGSGFPS